MSTHQEADAADEDAEVEDLASDGEYDNVDSTGLQAAAPAEAAAAAVDPPAAAAAAPSAGPAAPPGSLFSFFMRK
mgnify:CR=1 FL=1